MRTQKEVACPTCKAKVAMRINRNGFFQRSVLGFFGIYPWKCGACGSVFFYRRRGLKVRSTRNGPESDDSAARKHGQA